MLMPQYAQPHDRVRQFVRLAAAAPRVKRPARPRHAPRRRPDARSRGILLLPHPIWGCSLN